MKITPRHIAEGFRQYQVQFRHVSVLFLVILGFQIVVTFLHKASLQGFLSRTQEWYQQDSAERLANLTTTSLELLLEARAKGRSGDDQDERRLVQGINIILSQQILNQNVREICILIPRDSAIVAIDDGQALYDYLFGGGRISHPGSGPHDAAIARFRDIREKMVSAEQIQTQVEGKQTFHIFVPFVPQGEFVGAVYMKNAPDFSFITREISTSYDETALSFTAVILFGLVAMFFISSYTLKERDDAQKQLFDKEKDLLAEQITHQKETHFTKRIYHTHHKAEKVMGFIKEDLRALDAGNIEETKHRVTKYSNFIARVIYDMKWFDPPLQAVRGQHFSTDVNDVLRFLVKNVFGRVSSDAVGYRIAMELDPGITPVPINEFVLWELFEPLIQNCLEHSGLAAPSVRIATVHDPAGQRTVVSIEDNGIGFAPRLLERNERGVQRIFLEEVSTKAKENQHSGYGCSIAYEIATQRCGWTLEAETPAGGGARFVITIPRG
jgi:hypothetical protein